MCVVSVTSAMMKSLESHVVSAPITGVADHTVKACARLPTLLFKRTVFVAASTTVSPRSTETPEVKVARYHWIVMVAGDPSLVTRSNSIVVQGLEHPATGPSRPRTVDAIGLLELLLSEKMRNDVDGSTPSIVTVVMPLAELVVEPDW